MDHVTTSMEASRWAGLKLPGQNELPCDDGEPMETSYHVAQNAVLVDALHFNRDECPDCYVATNMFVYFSEQQIKRNDFRGPDVFVVLDADRTPRKSWVAWEEGGRLPDVVIEITSESTAHVDRGEKMRIYSRIWRTPAYFIFDPETEKLEGYRLDVDRLEYVAIEPDERGDLPVAPLGLALGLRRTRFRDFDRLFVRWIAPDGSPLPLPEEALNSERSRAEQERSRAESADAERERALERVRELEQQLAALKKR